MKKLRSIIIFAVTVLPISAAVYVITDDIDPLRSFHLGSQLEWGEPRYSSFKDALSRSSPALRANIAEFTNCMRNEKTCDRGPIFAERDQILAREWPTIGPRLMKRKDWKPAARKEYERFHEDTYYNPPEILACLPVIEYRKQSETGNILVKYVRLRNCRVLVTLGSPV